MDKYINKIICGDCLDIMCDMPDKCVDLVLTDPPYGVDIGNQSQGKGGVAIKIDYGINDWDKRPPTKDVFKELFRISKNQIIFGGNYFVEHLKTSPCWIIWNKDNGESDFADCELAWTSFNSAVRIIKYRWAGMLQQKGVKKEKRVHPTQKPVGVMEWILNNYSKKNDIILDAYLGSGTVAIACKKLNRKYIGIEQEKKYCDIAEKRLSAVQPFLNFG